MAKLDAAQAIRNAIEAEHAARRFYQLLSESTADPEARAFLEEMAVAELEHARAIEREGESLFEGPIPQRADSVVDVIETVPNWKYVDDISFDEALSIAKAAEIQAYLYYDAIADSFTGASQSFFRTLAQAEQEHARRIDARRAAQAVANS
jgi:rubrerythrin